MGRRKEPVFAGLDYDPDEAAALLPVEPKPAATPQSKGKRGRKGKKPNAVEVQEVALPKRGRRKKEEPLPPPEERGHGKGLVEGIHDHGALLNANDLQRSKFTECLTETAMTQLNNSRKQRGMMEAEELGSALFWRIPDNHQKRILELIRIMDNASVGHPKVRAKLVRRIVDKFLEEARNSRRPPK